MRMLAGQEMTDYFMMLYTQAAGGDDNHSVLWMSSVMQTLKIGTQSLSNIIINSTCPTALSFQRVFRVWHCTNVMACDFIWLPPSGTWI